MGGVPIKGGGNGSKHPSFSLGPAGEWSQESPRSPSPLRCRALNGWQSAAPPPLATQPQVRGASAPRPKSAGAPRTV